MATRKAGDPSQRSVLFEVAAYNDDGPGVALAGWYTIAWATTRMWADDIATAWHAETGQTVEVWQSDRRGDGWISTPMRHWERSPEDEPEATQVVVR